MPVLDDDIQEFYCADSGGGCGGYITMPINPQLNCVIEVICPKCNHRHKRGLKDGILTEIGRFNQKPTQEFCPTLAAWNKKSRHPESKRRAGGNEEREAVVIGEDFLVDRKFELWGAK